MRVRFAVAICLSVIFAANTVRASDDAALWTALKRGEAVGLMRHALAPGTGDPANFKVDDCGTQRNLSQCGRDQARQIGERFRKNGIMSARVYSSQWCRCRDTAMLLNLGPVKALPSLNSFYERYERRDQQTKALRAWLTKEHGRGPLVLVSHQVNISALTGQYTSSGEMVVVVLGKDGKVAVLGKL